MKIGVIGVGVVGGAVFKGLSVSGHDVRGYDKYRAKIDDVPLDSLINVLDTDICFVQVPTLTDIKTHQQNQEPLLDVLQQLGLSRYEGIVVVKSTVTPYTCYNMVGEVHKLTGHHLKIVHNPEFLTAAKPYEDFMNQPVIVLGGSIHHVTPVAKMFEETFPGVEIVKLRSTTHSEMVKYFHNCFLSVKVAFCNEMYEVCEEMMISYDQIKDTAVKAGGIGPGHTNVPGPDGQFGFGGMCFPKDTKAFNKFANDWGVTMRTLEAAIMGNYIRRGE
jgi:nucleotide sugar dehydrogenase